MLTKLNAHILYILNPRMSIGITCNAAMRYTMIAIRIVLMNLSGISVKTMGTATRRMINVSVGVSGLFTDRPIPKPYKMKIKRSSRSIILSVFRTTSAR